MSFFCVKHKSTIVAINEMEIFMIKKITLPLLLLTTSINANADFEIMTATDIFTLRHEYNEGKTKVTCEDFTNMFLPFINDEVETKKRVVNKFNTQENALADEIKFQNEQKINDKTTYDRLERKMRIAIKMATYKSPADEVSIDTKKRLRDMAYLTCKRSEL